MAVAARVAAAALCLCAAAMVPAAAAGPLLSLRNLTAPGDRLLTFDARTGLEWLSLTRTHRTPATEVLLALAPGAPLAGWRFATLQEVLELWRDAGLGNAGLLSGMGLATGAWGPCCLCAQCPLRCPRSAARARVCPQRSHGPTARAPLLLRYVYADYAAAGALQGMLGSWVYPPSPHLAHTAAAHTMLDLRVTAGFVDDFAAYPQAAGPYTGKVRGAVQPPPL